MKNQRTYSIASDDLCLEEISRCQDSIFSVFGILACVRVAIQYMAYEWEPVSGASLHVRYLTSGMPAGRYMSHVKNEVPSSPCFDV